MARPKNTQNIGRYDHTGKTNTKAITAITNAYSEEISAYKDFALERRNNRRYNIAEITRAMNGILDYVAGCAESGKPATIAGMILASGTNKTFYYAARSGEYDYITEEYIRSNNIDLSSCDTNQYGLLVFEDPQKSEVLLSPSSEILEKCLLLMENDLQIRSLTDKSMARTTGAIFNLKAVFNYNDKPEAEVKTVNNTLIVNASPEQTSKAMQLLLNDK